MADDAGVAAEQAAPGALAIASAVHDSRSQCLILRGTIAGSLQLWKPEGSVPKEDSLLACCVALEAGHHHPQQASCHHLMASDSEGRAPFRESFVLAERTLGRTHVKQERRNRHTTYKDACTARQQLKDATRSH